MLAAIALSVAAPVPTRIAGYDVGVWDRTRAAPVTECDRLAAYQSDRDAVAPGVSRERLDMAAGESACRFATARYPAEPRFAYQLARLLSYQQREPEAEALRRRAVAAGYPVAIFVAGHKLAFGGGERGHADRCGGAALIERAAAAGDFAASVSLADETLKGSFKACLPADAAGYLARNRGKAQGHFEGMLIDLLLRDLKPKAD